MMFTLIVGIVIVGAAVVTPLLNLWEDWRDGHFKFTWSANPFSCWHKSKYDQ